MHLPSSFSLPQSRIFLTRKIYKHTKSFLLCNKWTSGHHPTRELVLYPGIPPVSPPVPVRPPPSTWRQPRRIELINIIMNSAPFRFIVVTVTIHRVRRQICHHHHHWGVAMSWSLLVNPNEKLFELPAHVAYLFPEREKYVECNVYTYSETARTLAHVTTTTYIHIYIYLTHITPRVLTQCIS